MGQCMAFGSILDFNEAGSATDADFLNNVKTGVANGEIY